MAFQPSSTFSLTRRGLLGGLAGAALPASFAAPAVAATPKEVFADAAVPVLGNPEGDVAVAMWFDYQCPFCKKVEPVLWDVVTADGKVAVLLKDWPIFGKVSEKAALMVWSAQRQKRLRQVHDGLMAIEGRPSEARIDEVLRQTGVDRARLERDMEKDRPVFAALTARNHAQAEDFGFPGTPAFVIGSFVFGGVLDADGFRQAIADSRAKAK